MGGGGRPGGLLIFTPLSCIHVVDVGGGEGGGGGNGNTLLDEWKTLISSS